MVFHSPPESRRRTCDPRLSANKLAGRSVGAAHTVSSLISDPNQSRLAASAVAEIDRISHVFAHEPEPQVTGSLRGPPCIGTVPFFMPREMVSGPAQSVDENRLRRQRAHDPALRGLGQQAQRAIKVRFAAAIRAGYQVEFSQRHDQERIER
jgi:hypothetical protein